MICQLGYSNNYVDNDVTGINLTVDLDCQFLRERTFSIDASMMVALSNGTNNILSDCLVESDSFATDVTDEISATLNNNTGTSFIDSTNCAISESLNTTGLSNSEFELREMDVCTNVTITELDSAGNSNGNGKNSNTCGGLGIGAIVAINVIFPFILEVILMKHCKENENNNSKTNNKKANMKYTVSNQDTAVGKQVLGANISKNFSRNGFHIMIYLYVHAYVC